MRALGRNLAVAAAGLLVLVVCIVKAPPKADQRLVGTWGLAVEQILAADTTRSLPPAERAALRAVLLEAKVEVTFTPDRMHLCSSIPGRAADERSRYRIQRVEGNKVFVDFERKGGWETEILELYGDTLWLRAGGTRIALRRQSPPRA